MQTGELLFPAHQVGTEEQWGTHSGGTPFGVTGNYFDVSWVRWLRGGCELIPMVNDVLVHQYQVLNYTEYIPQAPWSNEPNVTIDGKLISETQLEYLVRLG
jgi:hypothetical protein